TDGHLCPTGAFFASERRQGVGNIREHVEKAALLGVDDLLHLGQLFMAKALLSGPFRSIFRVSGALQSLRSSASFLKNSGSFPNNNSMNCWADMGVPSGC